MNAPKKTWHKVLNKPEDLKENRVKTVTVENKDFCLTHFEGKICVLDNKCPHQGGPLGEGSIEKGLLRCPWHGWDYHPCSGKAPGFDDGVESYTVEVRKDGVYVAVEEEKQHRKSISDLMVETMLNWGVDRVFGMVGHSNLGLADALCRAEASGALKFYAIRHEGAASFAASAYGKLTGRPAACFAIAGPGSTNMFTGLWDAKVDRVPILALTGQVATQVIGTGNFQEIDLVQAFNTVAEFNHRVQAGSKHSELMALAIKHATLKRDVSHLTFPDEVQTLLAGDEPIETMDGRVTETTIAPPEKSLEETLIKIKTSSRPVIIVGHGARFNMAEIISFAEKLNAPVLTTFKGKGQISDSHPLAGGVLGRSGTPVASWLMNEADLLIVFGASFSNHTGITDHTPTIQVDFDPMALSKFHKIDVAVWGEIGVTVKLLLDRPGKGLSTVDPKADIADRWRIWRAEKKKRLGEDRGKGLSSISVFTALQKYAPENAVMTVDVGNNAYSFGRYYESKENNTFLMSGYLGSIGFALPAALGAWSAVGDKRPVIAVAGDSGFAQYMAEMTTVVKYKMPIKIILLNNSELGKISKEQHSGGFAVWKTDMHNPNFAEYANSCGALGVRVENEKDLDAAMKKIMECKGPALLEIITDSKLL